MAHLHYPPAIRAYRLNREWFQNTFFDVITIPDGALVCVRYLIQPLRSSTIARTRFNGINVSGNLLDRLNDRGIVYTKPLQAIGICDELCLISNAVGTI